jgi:hypothetical protein
MANTFTPFVSTTFNAEMAFPMTNLVVPDTIKQSIESVEIVHRNKFSNKHTGFNPVKHAVDKVTGNELLIDISIMFVGSLNKK